MGRKDDFILYFAYGSNLNREQMRERCSGAVHECLATLRGYRLTFGGRSRRWGGGVATVVPDETGAVDGLIYRLPEDEQELLDTYQSQYERITVTVRDEDNRNRVVQTYTLPEELIPTRPAARYLRALRNAYRDLGFDMNALTVAADRLK